MLPEGVVSFVLADSEYAKLAGIAGGDELLVGYAVRNERKANAAIATLGNSLSVGSYDSELFSRTFFSEAIRGFDLYLFVGILVGFVFLLSSFSILPFKQLMDAHEDEKRFEVLFKLGLDERDAGRISLIQVMPIYAHPLVLVSSHGIVALSLMGRVLGRDFSKPIAFTILCYSIIFASYGFITTGAYSKAIARRAS
jgi:hypothetical protein